MAKNELLPFANGEDANVLPTQQWEALTDILENGFQSGVARSEQVNRVLAQGAVASYVLGQLIVDQLNKDATLDKNTLYQNLVSALQENAKDACLPLTGGDVMGDLTVQGKNVVRSVNGVEADATGDVYIVGISETWSSGTNWYRKWSDGFIEQGGIATGGTSVNGDVITLPTPFTTNTYSLVGAVNRGVTLDNAAPLVVTFVTKFKTTFRASTMYAGNGAHAFAPYTFGWYASGY